MNYWPYLAGIVVGLAAVYGFTFRGSIAYRIRCWRNPGRRWLNNTDLTDQQLDSYWTVARQAIGTRKFFLAYANVNATHASDGRALTLEPKCVEVRTEMRPRLRGAVVFGWTDVRRRTIHNDVTKPDNIEYEMENLILWLLGYDVSGR